MADRKGSVSIGYQSGSTILETFWSDKLQLWWATSKVENRYWNAFGTEEPSWNTKTSHSITCEINIPFKGVNRRVAAVFARDDAGNIYLLHRGRIGGGKKNVGKTLFRETFRGEWEPVMENGNISNFALIGPLASLKFPAHVATFVHEVKRIKLKASQYTSIVKTPETQDQFTHEFEGPKIYQSKAEEIENKSNHALVVNTLAEHLQARGHHIGNTRHMDLFVVDKNNDIEQLFEVKTETHLTACYEAIGQLLFHSCTLRRKPTLVAVFPEDLRKKSVQTFQKLGIRCQRYRWADNKPIFQPIQQ